MILVQVINKEEIVADVKYEPGLLVDVDVKSKYRNETVSVKLMHSENEELTGVWEQALDRYFNEGVFRCKDHLFPGEMPRIGAAREHKSLFRQAAHALLKDLEPHGYTVDIHFE
jgi:hypothetical protein